MAVSSTMAACMLYMPTLVKPTYSSSKNSTPFGLNKNYVTLTRKTACWRFLARSSDDGSSETTATASDQSWEGEEDSSQIEMPKGPPSLISPLNIQKAIRGIGITDVDHYANLGLRPGCSYDQVIAAYETKVKEITSQEMDEEQLNKEMELLKESYVILSSEDERRLYDWSLARSAAPERYTWPFEADITQTSDDYGTPPPREPEDVGPTITVGYFIFGWLILSFIISIALNR